MTLRLPGQLPRMPWIIRAASITDLLKVSVWSSPRFAAAQLGWGGRNGGCRDDHADGTERGRTSATSVASAQRGSGPSHAGPGAGAGGYSRTEAARSAGMDRQTLRDWVHRFNEQGLAGLTDRARWCSGPVCRLPRRLSWRTWCGAVRTWPSAALAPCCTGWAFAGSLPACAIPATTHRRRRLSGQLRQPRREAALPEAARGKPLEVCWQDEARIGQQGTLTRVWAERSSRPCAPRDQRCLWAYLFGAVCPARGIGAALVLPFGNAQMMNLHLAEISARVTPVAHTVLVLNGAKYIYRDV